MNFHILDGNPQCSCLRRKQMRNKQTPLTWDKYYRPATEFRPVLTILVFCFCIRWSHFRKADFLTYSNLKAQFQGGVIDSLDKACQTRQSTILGLIANLAKQQSITMWHIWCLTKLCHCCSTNKTGINLVTPWHGFCQKSYWNYGVVYGPSQLHLWVKSMILSKK